ncbi:MAG: sulfite exporter TauE/SafE family protein [Deltaproteobacteria bacterium]|nr:sulfite exporter TauE/SafE family protein [Deltaproteobacteria bacterium]
MFPLLVSIFVASLLGSLHCVGMCGGFVAFYAGGSQQTRRARWLAHLAYNAGRLVTYLGLGGVAGLLGAGIDRMGRLASIQRGAMLTAGALMVIWGVVMLLPTLGLKQPRILRRVGARFGAVLGRFTDRLNQRPPVFRALSLGLLTTILPCGWLYAFVVGAASTGSVGGGVAVMTAFWLGTVPALLGLGLGLHGVMRRLGRRLPAVTAMVVIAIGVYSLVWRAGVSPQAHHKHHGALPMIYTPKADNAAHRQPARHVAPSQQTHAPAHDHH